MQKHERIVGYAEAYLGDYGFESVMVEARHRLAIELLTDLKPERILEAGCGAELLSGKAIAAGLPFKEWVIVEPATEFADAAERLAGKDSRIAVKRGFFEDGEWSRADGDPPFGFVILAGLLGEIADPAPVLRAAREAAGTSGIVHINVSNAFSLHRRLARAMGLIADEHEMSGRNKLLQQYRVYDPALLRAEVEAAGFRVRDEGGFFLKPFTHAQMEQLTAQIGTDILDGLWTLGREMPELASEIYVNAVTAP